MKHKKLIIWKSKIIDRRHKVAYNVAVGKDTLYTHVTELTFKCYVRTPVVGNRREADFFISYCLQ